MQHKSTLKKSLRSALRHKQLADKLLDNIVEIQSNHNVIMNKLDADTGAALDTDYAVDFVSEYDYDQLGSAQHKANLRKSLINALSHKRLANEIIDSIEELRYIYEQLVAKLNAEAGTLNDTDYADTFATIAIDADVKGHDAQHKSSFRKSLRSALSHKRLADEIIDSIAGLQGNLNDALAVLDTGTINGLMAAFVVSPINPE